MSRPILVWFRQDLRIADNPALHHAVESGKPVVCLYVRDTVTPNLKPHGGAMDWWLHHSLASLARSLERLGARLTLRSGPAADVVREVADTTGADAVAWNRRYGDPEQALDADIKAAFGEGARSFGGVLMHEPAKVRTGQGNFYRVYGPFWRNFDAADEPRKPLPAPDRLHGYEGDLFSDELDDWELLPTRPNWAGGISQTWRPGEDSAHETLRSFLRTDIEAYDEARDYPAQDRTSRMSPHLRFGEVSPHQLWHASKGEGGEGGRQTWRKELVWREFAYHLLHHFPDLGERNFQPKFDDFPWRDDSEAQADLRAWQKGRTGYPIVDAGMRQLWQTGWMHNRVRMIVGSFLVKHLLIDWRRGEEWFWDCLVDGDPANNTAQWQWVAGTGADAAPYFRIFNPITQASKFDPTGDYIRRYVPELSALPAKHLGAPWEAPEAVLRHAGVTLGQDYPPPIVDHKFARQRALDAFASLSAGGDR